MDKLILKGSIHTQGFTLVEAVVTGVLATIVAAVVISFITLFASQVREGSINATLTMQLENVVDQIARDVRGASVILKAGEVWSASPAYPDRKDVDAVILYDIAGNIVREYQVATDNGSLVLQERNPADAGWTTMTYAENPIVVSVAPNAFSISNQSKSVTLNFNIVLDGATLPFRGGTFRCRN